MQEVSRVKNRVSGERARPGARSAKAGFSELVVICTRCAKRQGFAKREVRGMLKRALKRSHPARKVRIVETGCLGPCPKRSLAAATTGSLAGGRILLLDPALSPDEAVAALLPDFGPKA